MNNKAEEYLAKTAIGNVFSDDASGVVDQLFGGSWLNMFEYITSDDGSYTSIVFPDPDYTDIANGLSEQGLMEIQVFMCEAYESHLMKDSLESAWDDAYYTIKYAFENGLTAEDFE